MTEEEKKHQKELWKQDRIRARHEEWMKIRKMGTGAKIQYFWDYYKIVLVLAAVSVLVIYLVFTMIHGIRTSTLLYACFLNTDSLDPDTETLKEDYIEARGGLEKMQEMVFDSSVWVNPGADGTSQQDVAATMKITSYVGAATLDVFLAPSYVTEFEQDNGLLMELDQILTEDEIKTLSEAGCLYYDKIPETDQKTEAEAGTGQKKESESETVSGGNAPALSGPEEVPLNTQAGEDTHIYAVRIDPSGVIGNYDIYEEGRQVWFSIIGNSGHVEEAAQFLRFLLAA